MESSGRASGTERFQETTVFFRGTIGLPLHELRDDFAWFTLPDSSQFEIFGPTDPDHRHFTTGPVPSFHIDDVHGAVAQFVGAWFRDVWPVGKSGTGLGAFPRRRREHLRPQRAS